MPLFLFKDIDLLPLLFPIKVNPSILMPDNSISSGGLCGKDIGTCET